MEKIVLSITSAIWAQCTNVTDRQTDKETDNGTVWIGLKRLHANNECITSKIATFYHPEKLIQKTSKFGVFSTFWHHPPIFVFSLQQNLNFEEIRTRCQFMIDVPPGVLKFRTLNDSSGWSWKLPNFWKKCHKNILLTASNTEK